MLVLFTTGAATFAQRQPLSSRRLENEVAIGRQIASNVQSRFSLLADPIIGEYVNRIAQKLARSGNSGSTTFFTTRVTSSNDANLIALPGFLFVNAGLILVADTEDELAAMLAHGIAHVTAGHAFGQREQASSLASRVPIEALRKASAIGVPIEFMWFTGIDEEEADRIGLQNLTAAGYHGQAILSVARKLQSSQSTVSMLFETHVLSTGRVQKIEQVIESTVPGDPTKSDSSEFQRIKRRVEDLMSRKTL
jgi:predicted Zn-dependent protease